MLGLVEKSGLPSGFSVTFEKVFTSDWRSIRNRNRESKISELFLVSESDNFVQISLTM